MEKMTAEQKNQMLFYSLVEQFRLQAWVSLGKIKNPATDRIERNLELARVSIDMLRMLKDKTTGNLSNEEERLLTQTIADLQLNYVDEYEKEKRMKAEKQTEEKKTEPEATPEEKKAEAKNIASNQSTGKASEAEESAGEEKKEEKANN